MGLKGRLTTMDRMIRFGVDTDGDCCFCLQKETLNHLLFGYAFTGHVWGALLQKIGIQRVPTEWEDEV